MPARAPRLPGPLDWVCGPCVRALYGGNGLYGAFFGVAVIVALGMIGGLYASAGPWVWRRSACHIVAAYPPNTTAAVQNDECNAVTLRFTQDGTDLLFNLSSVHNVPGLSARPSVRQCHATVGTTIDTCWWVRAHADGAITARKPTSTPVMREGPMCFGDADPAQVSPNPGDVAYAWQHGLGYCLFLALPYLVSVFRRTIGQAIWPSLRYEGSALDARSNSVDAAGLNRGLLSTDAGVDGGGNFAIQQHPRSASKDKRSRTRRRVAAVHCLMPMVGAVAALAMVGLVAWPALHDVQGDVCGVRALRPCAGAADNDVGTPQAGACCADLSINHPVAGSDDVVYSEGSIDITSPAKPLWPPLSPAALSRLHGGTAGGCHGSLTAGAALPLDAAGSADGGVDCSAKGGAGVAHPNASSPTFCCWYSGDAMGAATSLVSVSLLQDPSDVFCPRRNLTFAKPRVPMWIGDSAPTLSESNNGWRVAFSAVVAGIALVGSCVPCCALRLSRRMRDRTARRMAASGGVTSKGSYAASKGGRGRGSHARGGAASGAAAADDEGDCCLLCESTTIRICCCVSHAELVKHAVDIDDEAEDSYLDVDGDDFSFYSSWDSTRGLGDQPGMHSRDDSAVLGLRDGLDDHMALGPRPVTDVADPFARGGIMGGHHHGAW